MNKESTVKPFARANTPEQKEQRKKTLVNAAVRVLERDGLAQAGPNAIAREAGFSKANLYRYFDSREEIFLQIFLEDFKHWTKAVSAKLVKLPDTNDEEEIAHILISELMSHPRLITLASALASVLEHNVTAEILAKFKADMVKINSQILGSLRIALPDLSYEQVNFFLKSFHHLVKGMAPTTRVGTLPQESIEDSQMLEGDKELEEDIQQFLIIMLRGLRR
tara:strand:- start:1139 stop:1804 length:666 start_codon:yes stop_codon:yes gene_type:complete